MLTIREAASPEDIETARTLFRELEQFYTVTTGISIDFQNFESELAGLPGKYAPPHGAILLASNEQDWAGCAALRPLEPGICELKRLYVRPNLTGGGLGKKLMDATMNTARSIGYTRLRLDSLRRLTAAGRLYAHYPFTPIPAYNDCPHEDIYYLECVL